MELVVARNPEPESALPFLLWVPVDGGLVFRARATWPRTNAVYCHQVTPSEWPDAPDVVDRVPLRTCARRGAAIDIIADRSREQRSQLVFTRARGRPVVFWQSPRTVKQSRPDVRLPTARGSGVADLVIAIDAHERYPYRFSAQQVTTVRKGLRCGDYAVELGGQAVAAVERKSLQDLVASLASGRLAYALGELAGLPRAAVVVEDRYSRIFGLEHVRPAVVADWLAEVQLRWATVPIIWCETRKLAEEWTYRYLAAAHRWAQDEVDVGHRLRPFSPATPVSSAKPPAAGGADAGLAMPVVVASARERSAGDRAIPTAAVRTWAQRKGFPVAGRGRIAADVLAAWQAAHRADP